MVKSLLKSVIIFLVLRTCTVFGLKRLPRYFNGQWIWLSIESWRGINSVYEPYLADALKDNLTEGNVFIDVGAHFGLWSIFASKLVGVRGEVIACEPSDAFETLALNLPKRSCKALRIGVGASDTTGSFFGQGNATTGSFFRQITEINAAGHPDIPIDEHTAVPIRSLDSLMSELNLNPSVIKVDVEGFEYKVLLGSLDLLGSKSPTLIVEVHPPQLKLSGDSDERLLALLNEAEYEVKIIDRNPNSLYTIIAKRNLKS